MPIEFYNVKTRQKISVPEDKVQKTIFKRTNKDGSEQLRHAVRAEVDGMKLVKFVSKKDWDELNVPIVE